VDDLSMLVQLAGGESETTRRLKEAGLGSAEGLAFSDPEEIRRLTGLTAAAARRLVQAAREQAALPGWSGGREPILAPPGRPATVVPLLSEGSASRREDHPAPSAASVRPPAPAAPEPYSPPRVQLRTTMDPAIPPVPSRAALEEGVRNAEAAALFEDKRQPAASTRSFWRFGW
jgi:hypothetical protein